jgi:sRNA-binding carbon storage regulator CsrA
VPNSATNARPERFPGLTLTRHPGEGLLLRFGDVEVRVRRGNGNHLVIEAPKQIQILREELVR